jgi:transcription elongation factor Elf1
VPEITYASIAPLITDQTAEQSTLKVTFTCPVSGEVVSSSATMRHTEGIASAAKRSVASNLGWSVMRSVRQALGYNMAGRVAGDVARQAASSAGDKIQYGRKEKEAAAVEAFQRVASQFTWDEAGGRFVHQSAGAAAS